MSRDYYPEADTTTHIATKNGGTMQGGPKLATLHVTVGTHYNPHTTLYYGHESWPHMTIDRDGQAYQHLPANVAARSLANKGLRPGQTNRKGLVNFQVELVGNPAVPAYKESTHPNEAQLTTLAQVALWLEQEWGVPIRYPEQIASSYAEANDGQFRWSHTEINLYDGWLGHQHWVENDHWDPGNIRVDEVVERYIMATYEEAMAALINFVDSGAMKFTSDLHAGFTADGGNANTLRYVRRFLVAVAAHTEKPGSNPEAVADELFRMIEAAGEEAGFTIDDVIEELKNRLEN